MINTSKFAFAAVLVSATVASPVLAQAATRHHYADPPAYDYRSDPAPHLNPVDDPAMTGGGSEGYNECAGHPRC